MTMNTIPRSNLDTSVIELTCEELHQVVGGSRKIDSKSILFGGSGNDSLMSSEGLAGL